MSELNFAEIDRRYREREESSLEQWNKIRLNNPIVAAVFDSGGSLGDCVIALVEQNRALLDRNAILEGIAPRRIAIGEQTYIWRCPDDLVPDMPIQKDSLSSKNLGTGPHPTPHSPPDSRPGSSAGL